MKNRKRLSLFVLAGLTLVFAQWGCKKDKDEPEGSGYLQMEMTDAPGDYLHVYVDVKSVEVHRTNTDTAAASGTSGWITLNTRAGVYDLLTLQNNITAVLCDSTSLPSGKITQMRLILGINNSVVLNDSSSYSLNIPSSVNTGIKMNLNTSIEKDKTTRVLVDFDADQSIYVLGHGMYQMKPVIKVKSIIVQ